MSIRSSLGSNPSTQAHVPHSSPSVDLLEEARLESIVSRVMDKKLDQFHQNHNFRFADPLTGEVKMSHQLQNACQSEESTMSSSGTDYTEEEDSSSSSSSGNFASAGHTGRSYQRPHRRRHHQHGRLAHTLTPADLGMLRRMGLSKKEVEKCRSQQLRSLSRCRVEDLPDIPPTQFVVQISADSVPMFDGEMENWESFKELFLSFAEALPATQRLANLKLKLDTDSKNMISGCIGQDKRSFRKAIHILDRAYYKKDMLVNILVAKIDALLDHTYRDDQHYISMVSQIRAHQTRIQRIDPMQLLVLNTLVPRFASCLPDRPRHKVSNLMGSDPGQPMRFNFSRIMRIAERHVDWLHNQRAFRRACFPTSKQEESSSRRYDAGNFRSSRYHGRRPVAFTATEPEEIPSLEPEVPAPAATVPTVASQEELPAGGTLAAQVHPLQGKVRDRDCRPLPRQPSDAAELRPLQTSIQQATGGFGFVEPGPFCASYRSTEHTPPNCPEL